MKRIIVLISITIFSLPVLKAQNELDALIYSQVYSLGTARNVAMGGAFGAFGADFSTLSINPAGIGMYRSSELSLTPAMNYVVTNSNYLGQNREELVSNFFMSNGGMVFSRNTGKTSGLVNLNFGIGYNREDDYHQKIIMEGTNQNSSYLDYFAFMADGYEPQDLYPFEEGIAWDVFLIDSVIGQPLNYETVLSLWGSEPNSTYGQLQRRTILTKGGKGEYVFSAGGNFGHKFYFGGTFGIHNLNYQQEMDHYEADPDNSITEFDYFTFRERLSSKGTAYSFKLGFLFKPIQMLRLGAAIHFPYSYRIRQDYFTTIDAGYDTPDANGDYTYQSSAYADEPYKYKVNVPFRAVGSVGLQLFKLALIGVDVEYVDYTTMRLKEGIDGYDFYDENQAIREAYRDVLNFRGGAEVHLGFMYLRAGGAYYMSPYAEGEANNTADYFSFNGGLGIRDKSFFFDLAYSYAKRKEYYFLYPGNPAEAENKMTKHTLMATVGYKF